MYYYDPTTLHEWDLGAGEVLTVDVRSAAFPLGWSATATGAAMAVEASNAAYPQSSDDWFASSDTPNVPADGAAQDSETVPTGWLRWRCGTGGTGQVRIAAKGRIEATIS